MAHAPTPWIAVSSSDEHLNVATPSSASTGPPALPSPVQLAPPFQAAPKADDGTGSTSEAPPRLRRPANAWLLYRKDRLALLSDRDAKRPQGELSKAIAAAWKAEPPEVKGAYDAAAKATAAEHQAAHPEYKYTPRKRGDAAAARRGNPKRGGKQRRPPSELTLQMDTLDIPIGAGMARSRAFTAPPTLTVAPSEYSSAFDASTLHIAPLASPYFEGYDGLQRSPTYAALASPTSGFAQLEAGGGDGGSMAGDHVGSWPSTSSGFNLPDFSLRRPPLSADWQHTPLPPMPGSGFVDVAIPTSYAFPPSSAATLSAADQQGVHAWPEPTPFPLSPVEGYPVGPEFASVTRGPTDYAFPAAPVPPPSLPPYPPHSYSFPPRSTGPPSSVSSAPTTFGFSAQGTAATRSSTASVDYSSDIDWQVFRNVRVRRDDVYGVPLHAFLVQLAREADLTHSAPTPHSFSSEPETLPSPTWIARFQTQPPHSR